MLFRAAGDSLTTVANTKLGIIRMLNCWQHLQPLVKYNTYAQDEESIFAAWPYGDGLGDERWSVYNEANEMTAWTASSMYALEGGFVLVTNQPISAEEMKESTECHAATGQSFAWNEEGGGSTGAFGPNGRKLTQDTDSNFDGLVCCDIDLDVIDRAKTLADPVGRYSRPDLLHLVAENKPKNYQQLADGPPPTTLTSMFKPPGETVAESDWTGQTVV